MITVIGDVLLDKYEFCRNRKNPESSAPCHVVEKTIYKPGGAGNVAANIKSLGSEVLLISVVGNDDNARILNNHLKDINCNLVRDPNRPTILKERIMASSDGRYHYRKDIEMTLYLEDKHTQEIIDAVDGSDIIIVSDYGKGVISNKLMSYLCNSDKIVFVDPKPQHTDFYKGAFLVTPNIEEAREMSGIKEELGAAQSLVSKLKSNILLTRSEKGVTYFSLDSYGNPDDGTVELSSEQQNSEGDFTFPTQAKKVFDVTGAGDTVIATLAHFYSKGLSIQESTRLANIAAGISVAYPGCYQVTEKEIHDVDHDAVSSK